MTKKMAGMLLIPALILGLLAGCGQPGPQATDPVGSTAAPTEETKSPLEGTYDIEVWVPEEIRELTQQQIADFNATNDLGIQFRAVVEAVAEDDVMNRKWKEPQAGADIFCLPEESVASMVAWGALSGLETQVAEKIKTRHDDDAVEMVAYGEEILAYPMSADNGYIMYYDKAVVGEEDIGSLETLMAVCEESGRGLSFRLDDGRYFVSFFFATGCVSKWELEEHGHFYSCDDTFYSEAGLIAARGMQELITSSCYVNSDAVTNFAGENPSAVVISGVEHYAAALEILGDNLGVAELPAFEVDGESYHLWSFRHRRALGVRPQEDAQKEGALHELALYLTSRQCQLERFAKCAWMPSDLTAREDDTVLSAPYLAALTAQNNHSQQRLPIHGSWWKTVKTTVTGMVLGATPETAIHHYGNCIDELFCLCVTRWDNFSVVGNLEGTEWNRDFELNKQADGTWRSEQAFEMDTSTEFKVRTDHSWGHHFGAFGMRQGDAVTVSVPGIYYVCFDFDSGLIWLEEAE